MIPTPREQRSIDTLTVQFRDFDSVTKALQRSNVSCSDVRALFDGVISEYLCTEARLSQTGNIVHSSYFESGVVKIQEGRVSELTTKENQAVRKLRQASSFVNVALDDGSCSFAERLLKRRKSESSTDTFVDTRFLLPTSNLCERLFSKAGYALTCRRKKLSPACFEQQMLLHANARFWYISEIKSLLD